MSTFNMSEKDVLNMSYEKFIMYLNTIPIPDIDFDEDDDKTPTKSRSNKGGDTVRYVSFFDYAQEGD